MKELLTQQHELFRDVTAESVMREFDWKEGGPIPFTSVREMVLKYEKEISEGLARNSYHLIKSTIYSRLSGTRATPVLGGCMQQREFTDRMQTLHAYFIHVLQDEPKNQHPEAESCRLVFSYVADVERIAREYRQSSDRTFTGYDAFQKEKILFERLPRGIFSGRQSAIDALPDIHDSAAPQGFAEYDKMKSFLIHVLRPPEVFAEANAQIDKIWERHHFPLKEARALKQAIWEFGNHDFKQRGGFEMIGQCLVIPSQFEQFLQRRFGITLQSCELTGAKKRRASYDPEERAELDAGSWGTSVHEASIYQRTVSIDWTSRQFDSSLPIPEIIDLRTDKRLRDRIEIR